jgi:hypothetical protein
LAFWNLFNFAFTAEQSCELLKGQFVFMSQGILVEYLGNGQFRCLAVEIMDVVELILADKTILVEIFHFIEVSCIMWALDILLELCAEKQRVLLKVK